MFFKKWQAVTHTRLKKGIDYGKCGLKEMSETERTLDDKISSLVQFITKAKYIVVHTGAGKYSLKAFHFTSKTLGISTSTGIPNFRGPNGLWTREKQGKGLDLENDFRFEDANPSLTHMALLALLKTGKLKFICSRNGIYLIIIFLYCNFV